MKYDIKIINGKIADFSNETFRCSSIGIKDGRIIEIGLCNSEAIRTIDADGCIVSPGFIDSHMHEEIIGNTNDGDDFDIANKMLRMGVTTCIGGNCGFSWGGVDESKRFIDFIEREGAPVNYLLFAGYNSLRQEAGIENRYRPSTLEEQDYMYKALTDLLNKGVIGLSFGLEYDPGISYEEIIRICKKIKNSDLLLSAHFREDAENAMKSVEELINVSIDTGMQMHISHIGSCAAVGFMKPVLETITNAKNRGVKIEVDCYPYDVFSTSIGSAVFDEGWREKWGKSYEDIMLAEEPFKGMVCDANLFNRVRKEMPDLYVVASVMNEKEVIEAIKTPYVMIASDGTYIKGQGHPRGAGTFPKVLGRYVREMEELSLIEALKKMTLYPAKKIGLMNKGEIKGGMDAELVVFNPDIIIDNATFEKPDLPPSGIEYVIVNGKIAVEDNILRKNREGRFIRNNELHRNANVSSC